MDNNEGFVGQMRSPAGFVFGVQGWSWGEPRPTSITFFIDGSAMVCDQHGRPIKGTVTPDGKEVKFALTPPRGEADQMFLPRPFFATHQQVIAALAAERYDWTRLTRTGWPQLPYDQLKDIVPLPPTPATDLAKIPDRALRRDALRLRKERDDLSIKEMQEAEAGAD